MNNIRRCKDTKKLILCDNNLHLHRDNRLEELLDIIKFLLGVGLNE